MTAFLPPARLSRGHARIDSPLGELTLVADEEALLALLFPDRPTPGMDRGEQLPLATHGVLAQAACELAEYFAGERTAFGVPLRPAGTPFQQSAWAALGDIPYGHTRTYAAQAAALGRPTAVRAVGGANNRNPIPVIIPCHRVIGADGGLTGYAGGLAAKEWLLRLEGAVR